MMILPERLGMTVRFARSDLSLYPPRNSPRAGIGREPIVMRKQPAKGVEQWLLPAPAQQRNEGENDARIAIIYYRRVMQAGAGTGAGYAELAAHPALAANCRDARVASFVLRICAISSRNDFRVLNFRELTNSTSDKLRN
jgi:hypothetical protein